MPANFKDVKKLDLPQGSFAIVGSGPLGIRGIRPSNDIDILVAPNIWQDFSRKYPQRVNGNNIEIAPGIEIVCQSQYVANPSLLLRDIDIIDGLPFVKLAYIIELKKKYGREKDLADIKLIENYLAAGGK